MAWRIDFAPDAAKEFRKLPFVTQKRIRDYLRNRVLAAEHPTRFGRALHGPKAGLWRYRVGDYRVICRLDEERLTMLVLRIGHRSDVYR